MEKLFKLISCIIFCLLISSTNLMHAQTETNSKPANTQTAETKSKEAKARVYPVKFGHITIFKIENGIGTFNAAERAAAIENKLLNLAENPYYDLNKLILNEHEGITDIVTDNKVILSVTPKDAIKLNKSTKEVAQMVLDKIKVSILEYREEYNTKSLSFGGLKAVLLTVLLIFLIKLFAFIINKALSKIESWQKVNMIPTLKFQKSVILSDQQIIAILKVVSGIVKLFLFLLLFYVYLAIAFSFFPWTKDQSGMLYQYVVDTFNYLALILIQYFPHLIFILVVIIISVVITKVLKFIFNEIKNETIEFSWFYKEWSDTTYNICKFLVVAFAFAIIYPHLPGADSDSFKGVSIIVGILVSLGLGPSISNIISGIILTYTRAFNIGEWIKVGSNFGQVEEKSFLVTRIRTLKNEIISIPNSKIIGEEVVNYSILASGPGLIVYTEVTIGYDAPWETVHELLINAALDTEHILKDKKPFVLQKGLGDFSIRYEINAYTDKPELVVQTTSKLFENIQNKFNEAGVEIMSPNFFALRDGNKATIPDKYHPTGYEPPSFRVDLQNKDK